MLVKIEARILIFPGTDFHFPSTSVPPGTFFRLWAVAGPLFNSRLRPWDGYVALWSFHALLASCVTVHGMGGIRSIGRGLGGSERRRRVIG